jgi:hypothetical protein
MLQTSTGAASKGAIMTIVGWIQILLYCALVVALVKPRGWYITRVLDERRTPATIPGSGPREPARRGRATQCRELIARERFP